MRIEPDRNRLCAADLLRQFVFEMADQDRHPPGGALLSSRDVGEREVVDMGIRHENIVFVSRNERHEPATRDAFGVSRMSGGAAPLKFFINSERTRTPAFASDLFVCRPRPFARCRETPLLKRLGRTTK